MDVSLDVIQIYFDTATYDEIEKDVKVTVQSAHVDPFLFVKYQHRLHAQVTLESALGLIGGTMGLLTGFSILSGIEIVYYVLKFFFALRVTRKK